MAICIILLIFFALAVIIAITTEKEKKKIIARTVKVQQVADNFQKVDDDFLEDDELDIEAKLIFDNKVRELEKKMCCNFDKRLLSPQEKIDELREAIKAYHELKAYCATFGKYGKKFFFDKWQSCHNSKQAEFDYLEQLTFQLELHIENYDKELAEYNETKTILDMYSTSSEKDLPRYYDGNCEYIPINERSSIYTNETDTFVSRIGEVCEELEERLIPYTTLYQQSRCPYCGTKIQLPKQKKNCPLCKEKMYIAKGGIHQGYMILKEEDYLELKKLRKAFGIDKKYNPNYGSGVVVEKNKAT